MEDTFFLNEFIIVWAVGKLVPIRLFNRVWMVEKCFLGYVSVVLRNVILYIHNSTFYRYKRCVFANELVVR